MIGLALGLWLIFATTAEPADKEPVKPIFTISLSPSRGFMPFDSPFKVTATMLLVDPDYTMPCPGFVVWWGDGERSMQAPTTCIIPPEGERVVRRSWVKTHDYKKGLYGEVEAAILDLSADDAEEIRATTKIRIFTTVGEGRAGE